MSSEHALLAAIWDQPHDDVPRLVYADWLEETGTWVNRGRAELIRVQCTLEAADDPAERRALRDRGDRLLKSIRQVLLKGAAPLFRRSPFVRGFPYPTLGQTRNLHLIPVGRLAEAPLWRLGLWPGQGFDELIRRPEIERVGSFALRNGAEAWLDAVVTCRHFGNLTDLDLAGHCDPGGDHLLATLIRSPCLPALRRLAWSGMALTEVGIRDLAYGPLAGRLRSLKFHHAGVYARLVELISGSPLRDALREFTISQPGHGDAIARHLTSYPWFLHKLAIRQSRLTDAGCARLAAWPGLANLEELSLAGNPVTWDGVRALAASPYLKCSPACTVTVPAGVSREEWEAVARRLGRQTTLLNTAGHTLNSA